MVAIPKEVIDIAPEAVKVLETVSEGGQPHAIICGSIMVIGESKVAVGEVLMKRAKANILANGKASMLISAVPKSYELVLENAKREDSGPLFDKMKAGLAEHKLPCFAVWTFDVKEVWDEGAGPAAGTKIA
jgi:uncharacterized protein